MSVRTVLQRTEPPLVWLDVVSPTKDELVELARTYGLQHTAVKDCLDPEHLPKFEQFETHTFAIIRAFDEGSEETCGTVQELTRKIAIFSGPTFLITIHRTEQPWLAALAAMLSSCAAGVTVVNIDNGFGAAGAASRIVRRIAGGKGGKKK